MRQKRSCTCHQNLRLLCPLFCQCSNLSLFVLTNTPENQQLVKKVTELLVTKGVNQRLGVNQLFFFKENYFIVNSYLHYRNSIDLWLVISVFTCFVKAFFSAYVNIKFLHFILNVLNDRFSQSNNICKCYVFLSV